MNVSGWAHIVGRGGLYDRKGEVCDGSQGMGPDEAQTIMRDWTRDERRDSRPADYTYVPGRVLTDTEYDQWLSMETHKGRPLSFDEAATALGWTV